MDFDFSVVDSDAQNMFNFGCNYRFFSLLCPALLYPSPFLWYPMYGAQNKD